MAEVFDVLWAIEGMTLTEEATVKDAKRGAREPNLVYDIFRNVRLILFWHRVEASLHLYPCKLDGETLLPQALLVLLTFCNWLCCGVKSLAAHL